MSYGNRGKGGGVSSDPGSYRSFLHFPLALLIVFHWWMKVIKEEDFGKDLLTHLHTPTSYITSD